MFALVLVIVEFDIREIRPFLQKKNRWVEEKIIHHFTHSRRPIRER